MGAMQQVLLATVTSLRVQDVFDIDTWTGTGANRSITNGFGPNLVWIKSQSNATDNVLFDTMQGATAYMASNSTAAEAIGATTLTAFTGSGYSLGTDIPNLVNTSARTYVGWAFNQAPGFFDLVSWSGNSTNRTIAHSLNAVPGMIIVKSLITATGWQVYHRSLANTDYAVLNTTAASATDATRWNSTTATSSVFSLGTATEVNNTADAYIAYVFGHDPAGLIQCGSFTTDGAGAATVALGWQPQWLLTKRTDNTGDWTILDATRGWTAGNDAALIANTAAAETSGSDYGAPTGTGFTYQGAASATYIYAVVRAP